MQAEGFDWVDCNNEAGVKTLQKYFRSNLVLSSSNGHSSMVLSTDEILKAAKFVLDPSQK